MDFPWWLSSKESACQCRRPRFCPWVGKIPQRRAWQSTPVFLPENPMDRGAWRATVHGVAKSRTRLKQLSRSSSINTHTHISLHTHTHTHACTHISIYGCKQKDTYHFSCIGIPNFFSIYFIIALSSLVKSICYMSCCFLWRVFKTFFL